MNHYIKITAEEGSGGGHLVAAICDAPDEKSLYTPLPHMLICAALVLVYHGRSVNNADLVRPGLCQGVAPLTARVKVGCAPHEVGRIVATCENLGLQQQAHFHSAVSY